MLACPSSPPGVCTGYDPCELSPTPLGAQIMGSSPELLAEAARYLVDRGAPRVDLNCGCPANTVTGHGAGSRWGVALPTQKGGGLVFGM